MSLEMIILNLREDLEVPLIRKDLTINLLMAAKALFTSK